MPAYPVNERILQDLVAALAKAKSADGAPAGLKPRRATTDLRDVDPKDLSVYVWADTFQPLPAPWGQTGWLMTVVIAAYVQESASDVPIDQRLLTAMSDVQRAVMVDPRRAGLCYADNALAPPQLGPDGLASCVWTYLECEFRTLRSDPTRLAPQSANEVLFGGGASLHLAAYAGPRSLGPWRRYADLKVTPLYEPDQRFGSDDRDGPARPRDVTDVSFHQAYEVEADYLNPDLLAWQLAGGPVGSYDQAGTPLANVAHVVAAVDSVVPLTDADRRPFYNVAAVTAVTSPAGVAYQAGRDWVADADALAEGLIRIPATSTIPAGSAVLVSFAPTAATGRPVFDAAMACSPRYRARLVWRASDGRTIVRDAFDAALAVESVTDAQSGPVHTKFKLTVLDDGSASPAGRVLMPAGVVPARGS